VRVIVDPGQYTNIIWPEYWLTHANIDKCGPAGVPIRQNLHQGVMHMKTLVTSRYAHNASSNFGPNWQRDHDYFVSALTKPPIYQAIADRAGRDVERHGRGSARCVLTPPNAANLDDSGVRRGRMSPSPRRSCGIVPRGRSATTSISAPTSANMTMVAKRPGPAGDESADTVLLDAARAAAVRLPRMLEGRLAHQRHAARART
jgi:hypothetical protein